MDIMKNYNLIASGIQASAAFIIIKSNIASIIKIPNLDSAKRKSCYDII